MKYLKITVYLILLTSCNYNAFDEKVATKITEITPEDLSVFEKLSIHLHEDIDTIKAVATNLTPSYADKTFFLTNSFYLSKVDSARYNGLIRTLKAQNVFRDWIDVSLEGPIKYRIKDNVHKGFLHIHELVYLTDTTHLFYPTHEIIIDSIIDKKWRYIYYKTPIR